MRHIQFISTWIGTGATSQDAQRCPAVDLWQTNGVRWSNLRDMGQPNVIPDPNVCVWECVAVEDNGVTLLEADTANYTILTDEEVTLILGLATRVEKGINWDAVPPEMKQSYDTLQSRDNEIALAFVAWYENNTLATAEFPNQTEWNEIAGRKNELLEKINGLAYYERAVTDEVITGYKPVERTAAANPKASKSKDEKPNAAEKTKVETFLKAKGVKVADAANLCKKADANATRGQIADGIVAYCNALPKKK